MPSPFISVICFQELFFSLSSQRSKKEKKVTTDLRLDRNKHINQQYISRANGLTLLIFRELDLLPKKVT